MRISQSQTRAAIDYLRTTPPHAQPKTPDVDMDVLLRVWDHLAALPQTRETAVALAIEHLRAGEPSASDVAEMIIARAIGDSVR